MTLVLKLVKALLVAGICRGSSQETGLELACEASRGSAGCPSKPGKPSGAHEEPAPTDVASLLQVTRQARLPGVNYGITSATCDCQWLGNGCKIVTPVPPGHVCQCYETVGAHYTCYGYALPCSGADRQLTVRSTQYPYNDVNLCDHPETSRSACNMAIDHQVRFSYNGRVEGADYRQYYDCKGYECECGRGAECHNCFTQPRDCEMRSWSGWSTCSKTCGSGVQSRSRSMKREGSDFTQPAGKMCGSLQTTGQQSCNTHPCPVDCALTTWGDWSTCSATCGPGKRSRSRTVATSPAAGGKPCENTEEEGDCPSSFCPQLEILKVCGKVVNAVDNSPVEGATVHLQAQSLQAETDSEGKFCFTGPPPGTTSLTATLQGWVDHHEPLTITEGMTSFADVVMSKKIASTKWRIILTWQKKPKDLDAHTKFGDCDVSYGNKTCDDDVSGVSGVLDLDNTDITAEQKPETTTVEADPSNCGNDCMIYFRVRSHSGATAQLPSAESTTVAPLSESQATVQVIHGDQEAESFEIGKAGNGAGVVKDHDWYVFAIDAKSGKVIACTKAQTECV